MDSAINSNAATTVAARAATLAVVILSLCVFLASRLRKALPQHRPSKRTGVHDEIAPSYQTSSLTTCTATIYLGSGGHSSEMLQLVSGLDITRYKLRHYIVGEDDDSSIEKVHRFELSRGESDLTNAFKSEGIPACVGSKQRERHSPASELSGYTVHRVPRSRYLHQSFLTTPFTLIRSLLVAVTLMRQLACLPERTPGRNQVRQKSVLLMNGPGTCVSLVLAVLALRVLGTVEDGQTPDIAFVESFARVQTLSLTGRLVYPLCDIFVVQWPTLQTRYPRAKCVGALV